jgi:multiple sugar transport system substrate-binding protein
MSKKIVTTNLISLLVALSLILTACQTSPPETVTEPIVAEEQAQQPVQAEKVKIVYWSHDFAPREKLDRKYMDKFKQDYPNVEIEYVLGPGDDAQYITKLITALAGGEGPDCYNLLSLGAGPIMAMGMAAPLDPKNFGFDSVDTMKAAYVDGILDGFIVDENLYAVPSEVSIYSMFLNKQMFTDAGLDPEKDYPKTWDEMLLLAEKMNKVENGQLVKRAFDFTYGMPDDATSPILTAAGMAHQLGGEIFSPDMQESVVNTMPWVRTFQFIQDWVYEHNYGNPALTVGFISFYEGNVAMFVSGSWYSSYVQEQNPAVYDVHTVVGLPRWSDAINSTGAYMYAYGQYVNSASSPEKQQACQALLKELSAHPEDYLAETGLLQPMKSLEATDVYKNTPNLNIFMQDMVGTPYWPAHPQSFEILDVLTRALQRVTTEREDVQKALDTAKSEIDAILANP